MSDNATMIPPSGQSHAANITREEGEPGDPGSSMIPQLPLLSSPGSEEDGGIARVVAAAAAAIEPSIDEQQSQPQQEQEPKPTAAKAQSPPMDPMPSTAVKNSHSSNDDIPAQPRGIMCCCGVMGRGSVLLDEDYYSYSNNKEENFNHNINSLELEKTSSILVTAISTSKTEEEDTAIGTTKDIDAKDIDTKIQNGVEAVDADLSQSSAMPNPESTDAKLVEQRTETEPSVAAAAAAALVVERLPPSTSPNQQLTHGSSSSNNNTNDHPELNSECLVDMLSASFEDETEQNEGEGVGGRAEEESSSNLVSGGTHLDSRRILENGTNNDALLPLVVAENAATATDANPDTDDTAIQPSLDDTHCSTLVCGALQNTTETSVDCSTVSEPPINSQDDDINPTILVDKSETPIPTMTDSESMARPASSDSPAVVNTSTKVAPAALPVGSMTGDGHIEQEPVVADGLNADDTTNDDVAHFVTAPMDTLVVPGSLLESAVAMPDNTGDSVSVSLDRPENKKSQDVIAGSNSTQNEEMNSLNLNQSSITTTDAAVTTNQERVAPLGSTDIVADADVQLIDTVEGEVHAVDENTKEEIMDTAFCPENEIPVEIDDDAANNVDATAAMEPTNIHEAIHETRSLNDSVCNDTGGVSDSKTTTSITESLLDSTDQVEQINNADSVTGPSTKEGRENAREQEDVHILNERTILHATENDAGSSTGPVINTNSLLEVVATSIPDVKAQASIETTESQLAKEKPEIVCPTCFIEHIMESLDTSEKDNFVLPKSDLYVCTSDDKELLLKSHEGFFTPGDFPGIADIPSFVNAEAESSRAENEERHEYKDSARSSDATPKGFNVEAGTVSPYADFVSQQSAQIKANKQKEREARQSLSSPARTLHKATAKGSPGAGLVTPFTDFTAQQSAHIRESKQKEREARQSLSSPARTLHKATAKGSPGAALVTPFPDFTAQQSAHIRESKQKEREARKALSSPAQIDHKIRDSSFSGESLTDFMTQQSAQIRASKQTERDARQSLSSPAQSNQSQKVYVSPGTGLVAPFNDFTSHQSAQIKASKEKAREARQSLSTPARSLPIKENMDGTMIPFSDFASQQSAKLKAEKIRERETRQELSRPTKSLTADLHAADLRASDLEQKQKNREAQSMLASYRYVDASGSEDLQSRTAAELKRQNDLQKEKKKEAELLVTSYRHIEVVEDAQSRVAATMKQQHHLQMQKKKEAEQHTSSYRMSEQNLDDAASRNATYLKQEKEEQAKKRKEAEDLVASYRNISVNNDLSSQTALQLAALKEEQRVKRKEADDLANGYRSLGVVTGNAQEQMSAELKRQQDIDKQKRREAQEMITSYRIIADGIHPRTSVHGSEDGVDEEKSSKPVVDVVTSPRSFEDLKARTDEELKEIAISRKLLQAGGCGDSGDSPSNLECIRTKATEELASLCSASKRTMNSTADLDSGDANDAIQKGKVQTRKELDLLEGLHVSRKISMSNSDGEILSTSADKAINQAQEEISALQEHRTCLKATEELARCNQNSSLQQVQAMKQQELSGLNGITRERIALFSARAQSDASGVEQLKSRTAMELTSLHGEGKGTLDLAASFLSKAQRIDEIANSPVAGELSSLQRQNETRETQSATEIDAVKPTGGIEKVKSSTAIELENLKGNGSLKNLVQGFSQGRESPKVRLLKLNTADELAAVQKRKSSFQELAAGFNRGIKSTKAELLKAQAVEELAMVQAEQTRKKQGVENTLDPVVARVEVAAKAPVFTEAELAAFEQERLIKQQELEELKEFTSTKKLDSIRSRAAAELEEVAVRRKMTTDGQSGHSN